MTASPSTLAPRFEVKLLGAEIDHARVLAQLRLLPALLRPLYPERIVQTIYLDTHEAKALEENRAGISPRRKLRFRWYGEASDLVQGQLECKQRENEFLNKDLYVLPSAIAVEGSTRTAFSRALREAVPSRWRQRLCGREPSQWLRYRRDYLTSADGSLRITVDRGFRACDQRFAFRLTQSRPTPLPALLIVEIKGPPDAQAVIERCLQGIDLQPGKCSKFALASRPGDLAAVQRYE
jgi:hypothetical protein